MTTTSTLFDRLVSETAHLSPTPVPALSRDRLKRWTDLADFWKAEHTSFTNLFYEVIFHIARDRYSLATSNMKPLLRLIEEALLTEPEALSSWRQHPSFKTAFAAVLKGMHSGQRWKSLAMRSFVQNKLRMLLFYREKSPTELTLAIASNRWAQRDVLCWLKAQATCSRFEELIHLLVPDSRQWKHRQWISETFIFSQIQAIHGVNFAQHLNDFDALVYLFRNRAEGLPYYKALFLIQDLPASIASVIWPVDMEKDICKQFRIFCNVKPSQCYQYTRYKDPLAPSKVSKSWAFQQLEAWRKNQSYPISDKTKSNLLYIGLGYHPRNVKHEMLTSN